MTDAEIGFVERLLDRLVPIDFREEAAESPSTGVDSSWASGWTSAYVRVPAVGQRVRITRECSVKGLEGTVNLVLSREGGEITVRVAIDRTHGAPMFLGSEVEAIGENPRYILVPKEGS